MGTTQSISLLSNASASSDAAAWPGGEGLFSVKATWGGGSVKLQYTLPDGTWADAGVHTSLTADGGAQEIAWRSSSRRMTA